MTPPSSWSPGAQGAQGRANSGARGVDRATMAARADTLRSLHRPGDPLLLPNVWDAASARVVEAAGFPAIATSSAAVAEALGYSDGEAAPPSEVLDAVARIVDAVAVPVTADLERGYGMAPDELVERVAAAGAVGVNLEDSDPPTDTLIEMERQADFLAAVRAAADAAGTGLVINARVDVFMHGAGPTGERLEEAVRRARRYLAAGADCVYPILAPDADTIRALVEQAGGPVNAICLPRTPPLPELMRLGVARISFGPGIYRAVYWHLKDLAGRIAAGTDPYPR